MECFNSRTPGGVRLLTAIPGAKPPLFQFTHPGRGATFTSDDLLIRPKVSIHAPREGCDTLIKCTPYGTTCFNSRTPGGVRLIGSKGKSSMTISFNSRTPGGVRPLTRSPVVLIYGFQFTHPGRGATTKVLIIDLARGVSIHAPREGCDLFHRCCSFRTLWFQFTHPGRGATLKLHRL